MDEDRISFQPKGAGLFHSGQQLVIQHGERLIWWQVQSVKTGVSSGEKNHRQYSQRLKLDIEQLYLETSSCHNFLSTLVQTQFTLKTWNQKRTLKKKECNS